MYLQASQQTGTGEVEKRRGRKLIQRAADEEGGEEVHPGASAFDTEHAHEGRVQKLAERIESAKLKVLGLPIHEQHERTPLADKAKKKGGVSPGAPAAGFQQTLCPSKPCPDVTPCTSKDATIQDPTISSCWNDDLEDFPTKIRPKPVVGHWMPEWNPLDICHDDLSGKPGDVIRPGCPWKGDKWGGGHTQPTDTDWWQDGWAGQVFVLENVFLDSNGRVFNATHLFDVGGCVPSPEVKTSP